MLFESRCFWHPKDIEYASDYEDAFCVGEQGIVAIADGVASAMFSGQWARILTRGVVDNPPNLEDRDACRAWLATLRAQWTETVDLSRLDYFQKEKLKRVRGGYSTLLWSELRVEDEAPEENRDIVTFRLRSWCTGDCCLFLVRDAEVLSKFPIEDVREFELDPLAICSVDLDRHEAIDFRSHEQRCQSGDLVILASDAISKWVYQQLEREQTVDWEQFWKMDADAWTDTVTELRALPPGHRMRSDDTTLVMLRLALRSQLTLESADANPESEARCVISPVSVADHSEPSQEDSDTADMASDEQLACDTSESVDVAKPTGPPAAVPPIERIEETESDRVTQAGESGKPQESEEAVAVAADSNCADRHEDSGTKASTKSSGQKKSDNDEQSSSVVRGFRAYHIRGLGSHEDLSRVAG